jgi:hypothetical protein
MPGASGEEKAHAVPTRAALAKLPGVVPSARVDGLPPVAGIE